MKKIKIGVTDLISRLCAVGLTLLGFGCSSNDECMYGTPTGSWDINGNVTEVDGSPVENAEIRVTGPNVPSGVMSISTTETNYEGSYKIESGGFPSDLKVVCIPDDPALEPDSVIVKMEYHKDKHDKNPWSYGHAEATVDFKLRSKDK